MTKVNILINGSAKSQKSFRSNNSALLNFYNFAFIIVMSFIGFVAEATNLVPNPGFENTSDWTYYSGLGTYTGAYDNIIAHTGSRSYSITCTGEIGYAWVCSPIIENIIPFEMTNKTTYHLALSVKGIDVKPTVTIYYYTASGAAKSETLTLKSGTFDWTDFNWTLLAPAETTRIRVYLQNYSTGTAWFDDICLEEASLTPAEEATLLISEGSYYLYEPRNNAEDPALAAGYADYIIYHRKNPGFMYKDSIPQPEEIISQINIFGTPGQSVPFWTSVYAVDNNFDMAVVLESDFTDGFGHSIPKEHVKINYIETWNQRVPYMICGIGYRYYNIPERLMPVTQTVPVIQGQSKGFWFQVPLPQNCTPGTYQATVKFSANSVEKSIVVELKVFPFTLEQPADNLSSLFSTMGSINTMTDIQAERYLMDMKEYGVSDLEFTLNPFRTITGWQAYTWSGDYITTISKLEKYSGDRSLYIKCRGTTGRAAWHYLDAIPVNENTNYSLSLYVKGDLLTAGKVMIWYTDSTGVTSKTFSLPSGTYGWTNYSNTFTTPPGTTSIKMYLENRGTGSVWFDDVSIVQGISANMVSNPGFEDGIDFTLSGGRITGWYSEEIARFLTLRRNIEFKGRLIPFCGPMLEIAAGEVLGIDVDSFSGPFSEMNNEILKQGFQDALLAIDAFIQTYAGGEDYEEWFYYGVDEPHNSADKTERALWEYPLAKEIGLKTCGTVYYDSTIEQLGAY
ncbi:MAG: carbohydrate binding domain-containing protein [Victivallaceae bacterium]|nr:carbohydrate binding domain-containing protein [Victivallaceae bacterium]